VVGLFSSDIGGILLGITSAIFYGSGDFSGGLAARRLNPYLVLGVGSLVSILAMGGLAIILGEAWPSGVTITWSLLAGVAGAFGLALLYLGLSRGGAAIVSPVSGVIGAALPVLFAALTKGMPETPQLAGFALAILGIWFVAFNPGEGSVGSRRQFFLGLLAGVGFGLFFILLSRIEQNITFGPLAFAKLASCLLAVGIVLLRRTPRPALRTHLGAYGFALLAGLLDPAANALFLAASRLSRVDVAAVLASLYPAFTVLLSHWIIGEKISRGQWIGVGLCLGAIIFIS
jgi:drug/metabolite transporter (DMT)-like permease